MAKNRFTEADLVGKKIVGGVGHKAAAKPAPKKNKFGAIKVPDPETGRLIDSKQEAKDRAKYRVMLRNGEIALYAPQPEVVAATGIVYRGDHLVIRMVDGAAEIEIADSKGMETPEFKLKWKLVTEKFPQFKWTKLSSRKPQPSKPKSVKPKKR